LFFKEGPKVNDKAPDFTLRSHLGDTIELSNYRDKKNVLIAFFPLSWTPVCSNQIPGYEKDLDRFKELNTQVLAISVDSIPCLQAWQKTLGGIMYPLLSDFWPHGEISKKYGVLTEDGFADRVIFIVDKKGIIRYIDNVGLKILPNNEEVLKILSELR
jgi:peroxiredoxin (alkyl hydroperoxide reductase subunit C)